MSDTKALQDVVAKALANWGNGEAQDAFEAIMRQLRGADDLLATGLMDAVSRIDAEMRDRAQRAEADNAALVAWVNENGHRIGDRLCPYTGGYACEPGCMAHSIHTQPHPGAALLEELEGMRKQVELQKAVIAGLQDGIEDAKAAIHNAALEEAEGSLFHLGFSEDAMGRETLHRAMERIRALKKTGQGA